MTLRQWASAAVGVLVVALVAGMLFSRADPQRAARLLIRDRVVTEPVEEVTGGPAPTSGEPVDPPRCGALAFPIPVQEQVDAIAAGLVVLQYRDPADADAIEAVVASAPTTVLAGPNEELDVAVMATAWTRRMRLDELNPEVVRAFVTAHAGLGPDVMDCAA